MEFFSTWWCWIVIAILLVVIGILWQQLQKWKKWKDDMKKWRDQDLAEWIAQNCGAPDYPPAPDPPTWPNGEW